ncbi:pyridoxal 5'-phosphate synthase [Curtobacterium sp. 9128]|uniref:pyridoxine/pyridoxamine 5'-phosphate oxidase n=1 Tax=Curtobacterium sp. 9128 TaxID=1793722 RepID=UPI001C931752|nr:pyridoxamine 5'-phosphate oxidase family protein [Curtobacterium sp. 9128]
MTTVLPGSGRAAANDGGAAPSEGRAAPSDPLALAASWLPDTGAPVTMTLSTIGLDGWPSARTVLLSRFDGERLHFHTDARSRKAAEVAALPRATVTITWPEAARQLVVTGDVARVTDQEARDAYAARTRYLQVLAWVNDHPLAAADEDSRRAAWAAFAAEHPEPVLEPPDTWVGFAITPRRMLFWRGASDAPSNRAVYERAADGTWTTERWPG